MSTWLFDLDGTLVDSAPQLGAALNRQRQRYGLPPLTSDSIRPYASHGARGLLALGFDLRPEQTEFEAMQAEYLALYTQCATASQLFDGIAQVLDALPAQCWGIVTNKHRCFTRPIIQALGLDRRVGCVVCADDVRHPKPAADALLLAAQQLGVAARDCVYVGDAERDVLAGNAAGMKTIVASYGYLSTQDHPQDWGAAMIVNSPLELLQMVRAVND